MAIWVFHFSSQGAAVWLRKPIKQHILICQRVIGWLDSLRSSEISEKKAEEDGIRNQRQEIPFAKTLAPHYWS